MEKSTFEKIKIIASTHNKTSAYSRSVSKRNQHGIEMKENITENVLKSKNGQILVLEYLAPRRSCRVNIKVTAFANGM